MRKVINEMSKLIPDKIYISIVYFRHFHKFPDLKNPKTYNEKLQWLKLHDHNPVYPQMVDKIEAKEYVSNLIGEEYIVPIYGIWDKAEQIDFASLPDQFVLKTNHNSGGIIICRDKDKLDKQDAVRKLNMWLKRSGFWYGREWPYKEVKPRIFAEKYMVDESNEELKDYKVMCFNGEPRLIELHSGRFTDHQSQDFYDVNWNKLSITQNNSESYKTTEKVVPRPETLEKMLTFSKKLSSGISHLRVDWYSIREKLYFGELTFFDGSGFVPYDNPDDDLMLGSWISLPEKE